MHQNKGAKWLSSDHTPTTKTVFVEIDGPDGLAQPLKEQLREQLIGLGWQNDVYVEKFVVIGD